MEVLKRWHCIVEYYVKNIMFGNRVVEMEEVSGLAHIIQERDPVRDREKRKRETLENEQNQRQGGSPRDPGSVAIPRSRMHDNVVSRDPGYYGLALLVALPLNFGIKERLRVVECNEGFCVVCLREVEEGEELRGVPNCGHVFHMDCIHGWIDRCKTTCPLCRCDLLPGGDEGGQMDPWRRERMIYLFGEDSFPSSWY